MFNDVKERKQEERDADGGAGCHSAYGLQKTESIEKSVRVLAVIPNGDKISPVKLHTCNTMLQSEFG